MEKPLFTPIDARRPATGDELLNYGVALSPAGRFMSDQEIGKFREDVNIVKGNSTSIAFYSAIAGVVICEAVNLMATHHPKWAVAAAIGATVPTVLAYSAKWFQTWYMDHTITHDPFRRYGLPRPFGPRNDGSRTKSTLQTCHYPLRSADNTPCSTFHGRNWR